MDAVEMLSPTGPIAKRLDHYESRPQQIEMAEAVGKAFAARGHLIVEAGTGVGKSFAYLLPAIERAVRHHERVVVSTRTIALQEQLMHKDIPFLRSVVPAKFSVELVKGRANYLGLRRLEMASRRQELLFAQQKSRDELWRIEDWARHTSDGSLSDLEVRPAPEIWERARSEHDNCMGRRCPYYEKCFFQRARRRVHHADILVVNHALFFADLALRGQGAAVLPDYDCVVLDEAHSVEQVAGDHFGVGVSDRQVDHLLNTLHNERTRRGVLASCGLQSAIHAVTDVRRMTELFFDRLAEWQFLHGRSNGRLTEPAPVENQVADALRGLAVTLRGGRSEVQDENDRFELTAQYERAEALAEQLEALFSMDEQDWVYWLEVERRKRRRVTMRGRPIDLSETLKAMLFDATDSVVLTSATLATGERDGLKYIRSRVGLEDATELLLGSPFDYATQMTVRVEASMPAPSDGPNVVPAVCHAIGKYISRSHGGTLVLFTSYKMLNACATHLAPVLAEQDVELLVHGGDLSRSAMLDRFRENIRSVIFGTDSFWEGIDVPGDALTTVIVVRLPFAVPDRPETEARIEHIRNHGGQPFRAFQLPEAILKFKQGVGRLIRSQRDRGTVVVLDPRIASKSYGRAFLRALPSCPVIVENAD